MATAADDEGCVTKVGRTSVELALVLGIIASFMGSCMGTLALIEEILPAGLPPGVFQVGDDTLVRWGSAADPLRLAALAWAFTVGVTVMYGVQVALGWVGSRWFASSAEPLTLYDMTLALAARPKAWLLLAAGSMGPLVALDGGLHDPYAATLSADGVVLHMPLRDLSGTDLQTWTDDGGLNLELDGTALRVVVTDDATRTLVADALGAR